MNKREFLGALRQGLTGIPQDDIEEWINFYGEMIDDRIEEGLAEEQAIAELGTIQDIAIQIMSEIPLTKLVKEKVKPNRTLRATEILLLVLGSPIWLSLLIALFAIAISIYAVIWSLIISLWAIAFSVVACSVGGVFASVVFIPQGNIASGIAMLGVGLVCAGLAIFAWYGCKCAANAILKLTKQIFIWIKSCFIKKEATK